MKKILFFSCIIAMGLFLKSCNKTVKNANDDVVDSTEQAVPDSTIYGICGTGTSMNSLELITDNGDSLSFVIDEEMTSFKGNSIVKGGLIAGDRIAVVGRNDSEMGLLAENIINLSTLMGRWTSLDRDFEILEDGKVKSNLDIESNPYVAWSIVNGSLILNRDTFDILVLGADSLSIENSNGIFDYKRRATRDARK